MILTVSPNVALDRVRVIRGFQPGKQSRAITEFLQPGGSGVHATSVIQALGGNSIALGLIGGHTGALWRAEADRRALRHDMVSIPKETRESFCLIDLDLGSVVESVSEGPPVDPKYGEMLLTRLEAHLPAAALVILSGSLPPGLPTGLYSDMIQLARKYHVPTLADIHSEPLQHAVSSRPWLLKPNLYEFHKLIGAATHDLSEHIRASQDFCQETGIHLALSMAADGLLLTTREGQWLLSAPSIPMHLPGGRGQNVIGCGDALVGAMAYEYCKTNDMLDAASLGLAAAHYNLGTAGVPEIEAGPVREMVKHIQSERVR